MTIDPNYGHHESCACLRPGDAMCNCGQIYDTPPAHGDGEADDDEATEPTELQIEYARGYGDGIRDAERIAATSPTPEARDAVLSLVERKLRKLPKQWRSHIGPGPATREIRRADGDTDYCNDNAIWAETAMAIENFLYDFDAALALPAQGEGK